MDVFAVAWLHYDPIPSRDDLAKALIASFAQEGLIRPLRTTDTSIAHQARL
jgi:hypothetical protein